MTRYYDYSQLFPDAPVATPSLVDQKKVELAGKLSDKIDKLAPGPSLYDQAVTQEGNGGYVDLLQSEAMQGLGTLADAGKSGINKIFGTTLDDSPDTGYSNPDVADKAFGVNPADRIAGNQAQDAVLQDIIDKRYSDLPVDILKATPYTATSLARSIPEIIGGTALTPVAGAGLGVLANRGRKIFNTAKEVKKRYDELSKLQKGGNLLAKGGKHVAQEAGRASLLITDMATQQIGQYEKEFGPASTDRKLAITLGAAATEILEPSIFRKLLLPNFRGGIVKKGADVVKNLGKGSAILKSAGQVFAAAGAEGLQEYLQTWQENMSTQISPEEANNLVDAIRRYVTDPAHQAQAAQGGLLGAGAGGAARVATAGPVAAVNTGVGAAKLATKGTYKLAKKAGNHYANKAALGVLNENDRNAIKSEYESRKTVNEQKVADIDSKIQTFESSTTVEDIPNESDMAADVEKVRKSNKIDKEQLKDPKVFSAVKDKIIAGYKARKFGIEKDFRDSNIALAAQQIGKNTTDATTKAVKKAVKALPDITAEQIINKTKDLSKDAVTAIKDLNSGTARGIVDIVLEGGSKQSKIALQAAKDLELSDLKKVTAIIGSKNPKLGRAFQKAVQDKVASQERFGQSYNELITNETIPPAITAVAESGKVDVNEAAAVATLLNKTLSSRIADSETLDTVAKALKAYKESPAFIEKGTAGAITNDAMRVLEGKLDNAAKRLNKTNGESVANTVANHVGNAVKTVAKGGKKAVKGAKKLYDDNKDDIKENLSTISDTAKEVIGKTKRVPKVAEGDIKAAFDVAAFAITKENGRKKIIEGAKDVVASLNDNGYLTEQDLKDFVKQYPGFKNDKEVYQAIKKEYDANEKARNQTNIDMSEKTDNMVTKELKDQEYVDAYEKMFEGCKA